MNPGKDQLAKELYERIFKAEESNDLPRLLDPTILNLAKELAATFDQESPDVGIPSAACYNRCRLNAGGVSAGKRAVD
jgi:hypothetical protein